MLISLCPKCGFNNPSGMRFCGNCGARLENTAPCQNGASPVVTIQSEALIGPDVLQRIQHAGIEATGQRRNVTVLFADLSGYTSLSEQIDGEDLYEVVQEYIRLLITDVYKYEGIVDKLTGDGLMALFGAPIAHENNAERAVRAALDMQADVAKLSQEMKARLGFELNMRVGLHTGMVVVGGVGSNYLMDYTVIGDTVNLARRIEEAAAPGTILVSEKVYLQTHPLFEYHSASMTVLKGITHPAPVYRVAGVKTKPGRVRGIEGLRAPMIGRDCELASLRDAISTLVNLKRGQFVLVTGEAGLGKSRLTAEFKTGLSQFSVRVLEGQSLAYRRSISYWVILDTLYNYLGAGPSTPQHQVRERLLGSTHAALGNGAAEALPYLEHLLSLPYSDQASAERLRYLDAGQLRQRIFMAVRDLLVAESFRRPLLIVLEDLHWSDEASLELLRFLLESLRTAPIFLLAISRQIQPGPLQQAIEWAEGHLQNQFQQIHLQHLSIDQSEQLLHQLLLASHLPLELRQEILERAAGIPFYLEEILHMFIDQGAIRRDGDQWQLAQGAETVLRGVPESLQGLILARFDRLSPVQRRVLQAASVIGKNFNLSVLEEVLQASERSCAHAVLDELVEREFIFPLAGSEENSFTFRHILMADAIYGTILRRERSKIHGQVAEVIERLCADRLDSQVELLANHYRFSTRPDRALHYLILAGQKAARSHVIEPARQYFEGALELIQQIKYHPFQACQIHIGLGDLLIFSGDYPQARQHYQDAVQSIAGLKAEIYAEERSEIHRKIAKTYERQGDYNQALEHLALAQVALSSASQPLPVERAQVLNDIGWIHFRRGSFPEAQQLLQEALCLVEHTDALDAISSIYNRLGGVAYNQGDWDSAAGFLRKSIAIRESIGDVVGLATSFNNLGYLEIEMGEFDNALKNLTRSYELKKRLGQSEGIATALNNLGWLRVLRGEIPEAEQALGEALDLARQIGYSSLLRLIQRSSGELHLARREWDQAYQLLSETLQALLELHASDQLVDTYRLLGEACLGRGDLESAASWAEKAQELVEVLGNQKEELPAVQLGELRRFQGLLALQQGQWEAASRCLRESERIFQKLRSRLYQGRVAYGWGLLAEAQGDWRIARLRFREAVLFFQSIGARLEEQRAEEARLRLLS